MYEIKYRSESEMKSIQNTWIDTVPNDWKVMKLSYLSQIVTGNTPSKNIEKYYESGNIPWIKPDNIKDDFSISETKEKLSKSGAKIARLIPSNSAIVCCIGTVGKVGFNDKEATTNQQINSVVFDKPDKWLNKYGMYSIIASKSDHERNSSKVVVPILNKTQQGNIKMCCPGINEQQKIANFLDSKTTQFDQIIAKKEQLIKKLEEAKKSLISEVVTGKVKVIDGKLVEREASEMKDSGVEWLGMIPKKWDVKRIKNLFDLRNERNSKKMDDVQILTLYTAIGVRKQEDVESKTGNKVRTVQDYKIVYSRDIVVNIILAWMGSIGVSKDKGVISPAYDIYKPLKGVNSTFYNYLFRTAKFSGECFKYGRGIMLMRWRTYSDEFRSIYVCCPSEEEQNLISKFIDEKTIDINKVVQRNKEQIQKLKQAKQSLISEAVTGKIDLRDWEIIEEGELQ